MLCVLASPQSTAPFHGPGLALRRVRYRQSRRVHCPGRHLVWVMPLWLETLTPDASFKAAVAPPRPTGGALATSVQGNVGPRPPQLGPASSKASVRSSGWPAK